MLVRRPLVASSLIGLLACSPTELGELGEGPVEHFGESTHTIGLHSPSATVDVLFVIDNSSSMAEEQASLARNVEGFAHVLGSASYDYRIAFTTTDAGHPACSTSTPERGALVLSPCTSRLDEFVVTGEGGSTDVRALACTDSCNLAAGQLEIQPTSTAEDPVPGPRPWLERQAKGSNLPEGVDLADALPCFMPQGVAGCDFEAPLESMAQALYRAQDVLDPAYGFLRKDAALLVVIVTDEDDCSTNPAAASVFAADGDKQLWPDPDAAAPSSALCWNAGITCVGDPSHYDDCVPTNKGLDGAIDVADSDAVLRPPSRYVGLLDGILAEKQGFDPPQRVYFTVIGGSTRDGDSMFADVGDSDPIFQQTYGIGPGCTAKGPDADHPIRATPFPRLRAVHEQLSAGDRMSICAWDWSSVFATLSDPLVESLRPSCFRDCVLDTDPATDVVEPACVVEEVGFGSDERVRILECARDAGAYSIDPITDAYVMPADDVHVCHARLTDPDQATASTRDDMSSICLEDGFNLEFRIARRPGHPAGPNTRVLATCRLSEVPSLDCPGLGG